MTRKQLLHVGIRAADRVFVSFGPGRLRRKTSPTLMLRATTAAKAAILAKAPGTSDRQAEILAKRAARLADQLVWRKIGDGSPAWAHRVGRSSEKEKIVYGVFPHATWDNAAEKVVLTGGGYVVRDGPRYGVPYSRMKPVKEYSRRSAADKLSDKLTYGTPPRSRSFEGRRKATARRASR